MVLFLIFSPKGRWGFGLQNFTVFPKKTHSFSSNKQDNEKEKNRQLNITNYSYCYEKPESIGVIGNMRSEGHRILSG